ncbi:CapA family protein [Streptomyces sp.]|uniref:CapA family protein n=1 Tax=Streptomyces sp. TaxID=1931 RepID=UPI002F3E339A
MPDDARRMLVFAVGDVFIDRPDPSTAFSRSGDSFAGADIVFGNCEGVFSDRVERAPSCSAPVVAAGANAMPLAKAGFSVMSLANNHSVDGGHTGLLSCIRTLADLGIATVGAGATIAEARTPAVLTGRSGTRVAFLAYSAVFPHGYEAHVGLPGIAPLRAHTRYTPWEVNEWAPGLMPKVTTEAVMEDMSALGEDIRRARTLADLVFVSCHWGDATQPAMLTDHEKRVAHHAVDAGADAVFGHHHHMLRGVELYAGRPIFYGLGNYLFDLPNLPERLKETGYLGSSDPADRMAVRRRWGAYGIHPREGYPLLPFHEDSRLTGIAIVSAGKDGSLAAGFRPALVGPDNEPVRVRPDSPEGRQVLEYLQACTDAEELGSRLISPLPDSGLPDDCVQVVSGLPGAVQ